MMSGIMSHYSFNISDNSRIFKELNVFTDRYDCERNFIQLHPKDRNVEFHSLFVSDFFEGLNAEIKTYQDLSREIDWSNPHPKPRRRFVKEIDIAGNQVRPALDRLFKRCHMDKDQRAAMEAPIQVLEKCLEYNAKLSANITPDQKAILESFVEPHLTLLRGKMAPRQIKEAISTATAIVKGCIHDNRSLSSVSYQAEINKEWDDETKEQIQNSLYTIGRVLTGKANLEEAFLKAGSKLPSLKIQEKIVRVLF